MRIAAPCAGSALRMKAEIVQNSSRRKWPPTRPGKVSRTIFEGTLEDLHTSARHPCTLSSQWSSPREGGPGSGAGSRRRLAHRHSVCSGPATRAGKVRLGAGAAGKASTSPEPTPAAPDKCPSHRPLKTGRAWLIPLNSNRNMDCHSVYA